MKIVFYATLNKTREKELSFCFAEGVRKHSITCDVKDKSLAGESIDEYDIGVVFGVKSLSIVQRFLEEDKQAILIDKGFSRDTGHFKVCINDSSPLKYLMSTDYPNDRLKKWNPVVRPRKTTGNIIVFAGSSQKYCTVHGLGDATDFAKFAINILREHTNRTIMYRPKPSWNDAIPIEGTMYSRPPQSFKEALEDAYCVVTYGSNAAVESIIEGIPAIVLGNGAAQPVSSTRLQDIEYLKFPTAQERQQWLSNLAYCQFTQKEMMEGLAWKILNEQLQAN